MYTHIPDVVLMGLCTGELVTRAQGDLRDSVGRPSDEGQLVDVDPEQRVIGLHLYDGLLKVCLDVRSRLGVGAYVQVCMCVCTCASTPKWDVCEEQGCCSCEIAHHACTWRSPMWEITFLDVSGCMFGAVLLQRGGIRNAWTSLATLQIVPMTEDGRMKQAFSCRMEELSIIDITFLAGALGCVHA